MIPFIGFAPDLPPETPGAFTDCQNVLPEDAKTDMDLHHVVEKLVELSANGQALNMDNYNDIVGSVQEGGAEGLAPAEKLIKDVEYQPERSDDEEDVQEGHGRYWCSTDKRWKERKGPKQSRG